MLSPKTLLLSACLLSLSLIPVVHAGEGTQCSAPASVVPRVNMRRVEQTWLRWYNRVRAGQKLPRYRLDPSLARTAAEWSMSAAAKGSIDHKRSPDAPYYDYKAIEQWFRDRGLTFTNVHAATFTENIGWGPFRCATGDCTAAMIGAMRSTFRLFLSEKNKPSRPHYASIVNDNFRTIGLGIAIEPEQGRYYLTVHYATEVGGECAGG